MSIPDDLDADKLAEAALAILSLGTHSDGYGVRAWKGMDWDLMSMLHERGWIHDPKSAYFGTSRPPETAYRGHLFRARPGWSAGRALGRC